MCIMPLLGFGPQQRHQTTGDDVTWKTERGSFKREPTNVGLLLLLLLMREGNWRYIYGFRMESINPQRMTWWWWIEWMPVVIYVGRYRSQPYKRGPKNIYGSLRGAWAQVCDKTNASSGYGAIHAAQKLLKRLLTKSLPRTVCRATLVKF